MTKEELIEQLNAIPNGTEIRIGVFCDEVAFCRYTEIIINGKIVKCLQISRDDEN